MHSSQQTNHKKSNVLIMKANYQPHLKEEPGDSQASLDFEKVWLSHLHVHDMHLQGEAEAHDHGHVILTIILPISI